MRQRRGEAERFPAPPLNIDRVLFFQHPLAIEALAYWKSCLDGRAMPSRADLDPKKMKPFIANLSLLEPRENASGAREYFVRIAGSRLDQIYGPLTGKYIHEAIAPEFAERWRLVFDAAIEDARPIRTIGRMVFQHKSWLEVESLVAPLSNDGERVSMLFIVVATWEAGKAPKASP